MRLKTYYYLAKPGIVRGNLFAATAGYFLGSAGRIDWLGLAAMVAGLGLVIGSACAFNNYLDRDIDAKMERTKKRALPSGQVSTTSVLIYASILELFGAAILALFTNFLTVTAALFGVFCYVIVYGIGKRVTHWGTVIGSVSGSVPPVVGYVAAAGRLDMGAGLLFLIMALWQMPHFYALSIFRMKEYAAAGIPVWPVKKGIPSTKFQIIGFVAAFAVVSPLLSVFGYTGYVYMVAVLALGLYWLWRGARDYRVKDDVKWAKMMFGISLMVLSVQSLLIIADSWLRLI